MTDKELLELAAKVAGFGPKVCWTESEYPPKSGKSGALWNYVGYMDTAELWNPLTDDGDALRLAVKVGAWPMRGRVIPGDWSESNFIRVVVNNTQFDEMFTDDPYSATRRAIVRAAAEIGKGMK